MLSDKSSVDNISTQAGTTMSENSTQKVNCSNTSTTKNSQSETIPESSQEINNKENSLLRKNSHGLVKTSRNCSRPKPPLPPLKEKKKTEPRRRSSRQKEIKEKEVGNYFKIY